MAVPDDEGGAGPFAVIPVVDLRHGQVVRARAGERGSYAPIETPLAKGSDPAAIAAALVRACPSGLLYVADLDAIMDGVAPDAASLRAIAAACPGTRLWVDAGLSEAGAVEAVLAAGHVPVIGSESQRDGGLLAGFRAHAVLSLDRRGPERLGPAILHETPGLWPRAVIAMNLARVGAAGGPDFDEFDRLRRAAPAARIYAAGGVRGPADLAGLAAAGIAGALVASALHDGRLPPAALPGPARGC